MFDLRNVKGKLGVVGSSNILHGLVIESGGAFGDDFAEDFGQLRVFTEDGLLDGIEDVLFG